VRRVSDVARNVETKAASQRTWAGDQAVAAEVVGRLEGKERRHTHDEGPENGRIATLGQLIFFSTETGDGWLLDPEDGLAAPLARDGDPEPIHIEETDASFSIEWEGQLPHRGRPSSSSTARPAGPEPSSDTQRRSWNTPREAAEIFKYLWLGRVRSDAIRRQARYPAMACRLSLVRLATPRSPRMDR